VSFGSGRTFRTSPTFRVSPTFRSGGQLGGGGGQEPPDDPPVFTITPNVTDTTPTTITLAFASNQQVDAYIEYGTTTGYGNSTTAPGTYTTSYSIQVTGLTAGTEYHFRARIENQEGAETVSSDVSASTDAVGTLPAQRTLSYVAPTLPAFPSHAVKTLDTTWNTYYTRVTATAPGRHQYSTHRPWNSDETYFYVEGSSAGGGQHSLLNATTWATIRQLAPPSDFIWAHTQPKIMYGVNVSAGTLVSYNVDTLVTTTVKTFTGYTNLRLGFGDGGFSWDDNTFLLYGTFSGQKRLIGYTVDTDTTVTRNITNTPNNFKVSPGGSRGVVNYESNDGLGSEQGVWLINMTTLANIRQLKDNGDHGDVGLDSSDREIYVCSYPGGSYGAANIYSHRLDQSDALSDVGRLVPVASGGLFQQGHVSLQCIDRPGVAFLANSTYWSWGTTPGRGQVVEVPTDGTAFDGTPVRVWGFTRSDASTEGSDSTARYDREPQPCPNRDGTKVAVHSKWANNDLYTSAVHTYVFSAT
jgi:hypothetical protein